MLRIKKYRLFFNPYYICIYFYLHIHFMHKELLIRIKVIIIKLRKGFMDGNLAATVYYNFGEIADWENEPSRSGVWPKGTNHTYVDGVAIIVQAEAEDPSGNIIHPLESNYYEFTRYDQSTGVTYGWWPLPGYACPI